MMVHQVDQLLSIDLDDFKRYQEHYRRASGGCDVAAGALRPFLADGALAVLRIGFS